MSEEPRTWPWDDPPIQSEEELGQRLEERHQAIRRQAQIAIIDWYLVKKPRPVYLDFLHLRERLAAGGTLEGTDG